MISAYFSGEMKKQLDRYCNFINEISNDYDVLIFMARKAICFYNALVESGEIKLDSKVFVTSSRVLKYDCSFLKNKKIALIDDIIVKGRTLKETESAIKELGITDYDIFCIASSENYENSLIKKIGDNTWTISEDEILTLGNSITNFINSTACTYNVDHPIFRVMDEDSYQTFVDNYLNDESCKSIPSGAYKNDNELYVQLFDENRLIKEISKLLNDKTLSENAIAKIRFYVDRVHKRITAVPIVILPEMSKEQLSDIFNGVTNGLLDEMVLLNKDENVRYENMLNTIQYILAYRLFSSVMDNEFIDLFEFDSEKRDYIFPESYKKEIEDCLGKEYDYGYFEKKEIKCDLFDISVVFNKFYDFIGFKHKNDNEHKTKFTFSETLDSCDGVNDLEKKDLSNVLSLIVDYAIDTGLIVPVNRIENCKVARAYRLSEQYELKEKELDLMVYMYSNFMDKSNREEMSSIMVQKLAVLFFREVIPTILNEIKVSDEDEGKITSNNCFGICYARFGPVVSDSEDILNVSEDSYLSNRLTDEERGPFKGIRKKGNSKYELIKSDNLLDKNLDESWIQKTNQFALRYSDTEKILNRFNIYSEIENVKTFDKFLVLTSIGQSHSEQLLALASEVKLFKSKKSFPITHIHSFTNFYDKIANGIESGAWKYICFSNDALDNIKKNVESKLNEKKQKDEEIYKKNQELNNCLKAVEMLKSSKLDADEIVEVLIDIYNRLEIDKLDERQHMAKDEIMRCGGNQAEINNVVSKYIEKAIGRIKDQIVINSHYMPDPNNNYYHNPVNDIFIPMSVGMNKNEKVIQNYIDLKDEIGFFIYRLLKYWAIIIDNKWYSDKVTYKDKNKTYITQIEDILKSKEPYKNMLNIPSNLQIDELLFEINKMFYEADIILEKVNRFISNDKEDFYLCNKFYVVRKDDGDGIESSEIRTLKEAEIKLNTFWNCYDDLSLAFLKKSKESEKAIENFISGKHKGYTIIIYDCNEQWDSILQTRDKNCNYSPEVKKFINELLEENNDCILTVTERI